MYCSIYREICNIMGMGIYLLIIWLYFCINFRITISIFSRKYPFVTNIINWVLYMRKIDNLRMLNTDYMYLEFLE